jgi:3'-5' exonuclease/Ankyrin repeats (3 copies)
MDAHNELTLQGLNGVDCVGETLIASFGTNTTVLSIKSRLILRDETENWRRTRIAHRCRQHTQAIRSFAVILLLSICNMGPTGSSNSAIHVKALASPLQPYSANHLVAISSTTTVTDVKASNSQVRRAAGSQSLEQLRQALVGWSTKDIDGMASQDGKNAVHMAAWQGSLDNLRYLVEEKKCSIHTIATGEFSYGKTPLFFACTRSREDIIEYLLDQGAHVKLVNNKGQSVLSIASSHCSPEIVERIVQCEQEQEDVPWVNYRETHSDGLLYGDLDPRFLDRELTPDDDVTEYAINPTTKQSRKGSFYQRNPHLYKTKQTTETKLKTEIARSKAKSSPPVRSPEREVELQNAWDELEKSVNGQVRQVVWDLIRLYDQEKTPWTAEMAEKLQACSIGRDLDPPLLASFLISLAEPVLLPTDAMPRSDEMNADSNNGSNNDNDNNKDFEQKAADDSPRIVFLLHRLASIIASDKSLLIPKPPQLNRIKSPRIPRRRASLTEPLWQEACQAVSGLCIETLQSDREADGIPSDQLCLSQPAVWVESAAGLVQVIDCMERCRLVGIDTEWTTDDAGTHISTIQLAFRKEDTVEAFVLDCLKEDDDDFRQQSHAMVERLFKDHIILGFAVGHDIPKLKAWTNTELSRTNVLDLQLLWPKKDVPGLARCASMYSTKLLSKKEQCSEWGQRPLTASQLEYAGLDAAVLLMILAEKVRIEL